MAVTAFDELDRFRARSRALLEANRPLVDAFLEARDDLECIRPVGGSVFFPRLTSGNTEPFLQFLRDKYETTVVPGSFFEMPEHFRIGIGGASDELEQGLERLSAALDQYAKRSG
jgi:aspartate/methionine/tyrosine aminotransferase